MNNKLKKQFKTAFSPPPPQKKETFLNNQIFYKTSYADFLLSQLGYIRKRVWIISVIFGVLVTAIANCLNESFDIFSLAFFVSTFMPFLVLLTITELAKSASYNMLEIENSCRYNLIDITLARLCILSFVNLAIIILVLVLIFNSLHKDFLLMGIYLTLPFFITASFSLIILRRIKSKDKIYVCGGVSVFVSFINILLTTNFYFVFADKFLYIWIFLFCFFVSAAILQAAKILNRNEGLLCNLPLTV